jgi:hypothetical protein
VYWAQPLWVNLLVLIPPIAFWLCRKQGLSLPRRQLLWLALFAASFGFVEAAVVVYLRAATGLLPGYHGTLEDVQRASSEFYQQAQALNNFPQSLLTVEVFREAATILMLIAVAMLAASRAPARWLAFLWAFALWDITYYAGLWATVRWPGSLKDVDVLFLIPVPWIAPVWFPMLVSALTIAAVSVATVRNSA